jgi:hypothetical protein
LLCVSAVPETKKIKDMMPEILKQVGPAELKHLQSFLEGMGKAAKEENKDGDSDEDPPELVGTFEDAAKK